MRGGKAIVIRLLLVTLLSGAVLVFTLPTANASVADQGKWSPTTAFSTPTLQSEPGDGVKVAFPIDALPPGQTYVAIKRIRYLPGAELAEQPIDGPKLLIILSGELTLQVARAGATTHGALESGSSGSPLPPGEDHPIGSGTRVLVPAGVPLQSSNRSEAPVEWLQVQIETPATLCACGEDLSAVEMDVLASRTLDEPIASPATLSLHHRLLEPDGEIPAPDEGIVQLIGAMGDDSGHLQRREDGTASNTSSMPLEVFVVTIASGNASNSQ
jgi:hypothetical protein